MKSWSAKPLHDHIEIWPVNFEGAPVFANEKRVALEVRFIFCSIDCQDLLIEFHINDIAFWFQVYDNLKRSFKKVLLCKM